MSKHSGVGDLGQRATTSRIKKADDRDFRQIFWWVEHLACLIDLYLVGLMSYHLFKTEIDEKQRDG